MVHLDTVEQQLNAIGCNFKFFGRPEIKELTKILLPGETIAQCTNGYYEGGIALLVVTDHRLLLVDRKPMYLTIEDLRFDMISEIDFSHRLFNATIRIFSTNKSLMFTSWNHARLRKLVEYLQHRVVLIRNQQQHAMMQQFMQLPTYGYNGQPQMTPALPAQSETTYAPAGLAQVAMQGSANTAQQISPALVVPQPGSNTYTKGPLLSRRRKFPRFY
jgi:hypothetical protein